MAAVAACQSPARGSATGKDAVKTQYDPKTGGLEQLIVERPPDGSGEARVFMKGPRIDRIELDTNGDGQPDRWEYYVPAGPQTDTLTTAGPRSVIVRAEQTKGAGRKISRWEYYEGGVIARVEEDTDGDGWLDKWEHYATGTLASVDLDLAHNGRPNRRLIYRNDGSVDVVELGGPSRPSR